MDDLDRDLMEKTTNFLENEAIEILKDFPKEKLPILSAYVLAGAIASGASVSLNEDLEDDVLVEFLKDPRTRFGSIPKEEILSIIKELVNEGGI